MEIAIDKIRVGQRHRKDMGDINELAESIKLVGLLQPVVVVSRDQDYHLVAGARRLEACKSMGWDKVPCFAVSSFDTAVNAMIAERDENTCRKPFTVEEAVAIGESIAPMFEQEAKASQREHGNTAPGRAKSITSSNLDEVFAESEDSSSERRSDARTARAVGMKKTSYRKAKEVIAAAKAEPEKYGALVETMNKTGKVDGAHKRLKVDRAAEQIRSEPQTFPDGPFRVIVVDPPWEYGGAQRDPNRRAVNPYPGMPIEEIKLLPVSKIAHDDSILWLWTTNAYMREAREIAEAWGFVVKTILTWAKDRMGTGDWLRGQTEHCLMCVMGRPVVTLTNQTTLLHGPLREHSRKPEEFYAMVESLCPGSKCELFSRTPSEGWVQHGNQTELFSKEQHS